MKDSGIHSGQGAVIPGELVARLEVASAGDHALDAAIATAMGLYVYEKRDRDRKEWFYPTGEEWCQRKDSMSLPRYSRSLDAALALAERVLPGVWWLVGKGKVRSEEPDYGAQLLFGPDVIGEGEGPTPALALCVAVLKATSASSVGTSAASEPDKSPPETGGA